MRSEDGLLVRLLKLIDHVPTPRAPAKRPRGKPPKYSDKLMLKALIVMIIRRLYTATALLAFLAREGPTSEQLRALLHEEGAFPSRRTWERRLERWPRHWPGLIGHFGHHRVELLKPWTWHGRAAAMDSPALRTSGGVWHKKDREQGRIPHSSIDPEAGWSKSGSHGWWDGWKLHLALAVGWVGIPAGGRTDQRQGWRQRDCAAFDPRASRRSALRPGRHALPCAGSEN